jgi:hypothetical protein
LQEALVRLRFLEILSQLRQSFASLDSFSLYAAGARLLRRFENSSRTSISLL